MSELQTFRAVWRNRLTELRNIAPDMTVRELTALYRRPCLDAWIAELQGCSRDTVISLEVGRSLVAYIGHSEAGRMLRHVSNFPACLPMAQKGAENAEA